MKSVTRLRSRSTAAVLTALTLLALTAPPATAASVTVDDSGDATASLTDIQTVRVDHNDERVRVKVTFPDLRKRSRASLSVFFDSDPDRRGPERGVGLPLFGGSDYAMGRMRGWRFVGDRPVDCDYRASYRWGRDFLVLTADPACFGNPEEIRVGMRMSDSADSSHVVTDWLKGRRKFTRWIAAG